MTRYPVYIISNGRAAQWAKAKNRPTGRVLDEMGIPYKLVIEPQEQDDYARHVAPEKIVTLPFSNLNRGSIPARNWCWEDSIAHGHQRHWILDDNVCHFRRLGDNKKQEADATIFNEMEDFVDRFTNVALAGPDNVGFVRADARQYAYRLNTRIYSRCAAKVRKVYPHAYDDLDDATLTRKVLAKYPNYCDVTSSPGVVPEIKSIR